MPFLMTASLNQGYALKPGSSSVRFGRLQAQLNRVSTFYYTVGKIKNVNGCWSSVNLTSRV